MKNRHLLFFVSICILFLASCTATNNAGSSKSKEDNTKDGLTKAQLRTELTKECEEYLGTKYKYAGKTPDTGFDCSGFTSYVYDQFNINLSPSSKNQAVQGKAVMLSKVKPGDLVFFGNDGEITHVAMVISNTKEGIKVAHSTTSNGVMIQNISTSKYWKPKILFARDIISTN